MEKDTKPIHSSLLDDVLNFDDSFRTQAQSRSLPFQNAESLKSEADQVCTEIQNFEKIFADDRGKKTISVTSMNCGNDYGVKARTLPQMIRLPGHEQGNPIVNNANRMAAIAGSPLQTLEPKECRMTESRYFVDDFGRLCLLSRGKTDVITFLCNYSFKLIEVRLVDKGFSGVEQEREPIEKIYFIEVYPGKECGTFQPFYVSIRDADAIGETIYQMNPALAVNPNAQKVEANLKTFLAQQVPNVPIINIADYTGWCEGKYYLHSGGAIGCKGNVGNLRTLSSKTIEQNLNLSSREAFGWFIRATEMSNNLSKTVPLLMYNALSLNTTLFELAGHSYEFVTNIVGRTGSLKTTIAKIIFSVFNITTAKQGASMKDTVASMELKMFDFKDCALLVDDVFPAENSEDRKRLSILVSSIMRAIGDRNAKARVKSNMDRQKTYPPRGGVVLTSEIMLGTRSDLARSLVIEVDQNTYDREVVTDLQQNLVNLSTHWYHFIEWCAYNFDRIVSIVHDSFNEHRRYYEKHLQYQRQVDNLICLTITANLMAQYGMSVGYFKDVQEMEEMNRIWVESIEQAVVATEPLIEEQHPAIVFLEALNELIISGTCRLAGINDENDDPEHAGKIIGYSDEDYYYLLPEITYAAVKKHQAAMGKFFPFEMKRLLDSLEELSAIRIEVVTDENGKKTKNRTHKKKIQNARPRLLFLRRAVMDNVLDSINV